MGEDLEPTVAELLRTGAVDRAATRVLEAYGPELYGSLVHTLGDEADAGEVLSRTSEDLWAGLARFDGRCSLRTWICVLGHNATSLHRPPWNQRDQHATESRIPSATALEPNRTQPWLLKDELRGQAEAAGLLEAR